jgi:hypothetical protein
MSDQTEAEQGLADAEPVIQPVDDADAGVAETTETQTTDETPAQNAEAETAEPEKPKQTPWWQKRIDEVTKQKYEERQAREKIEAENKALRLLLEAGGTDPATATEAAPATLTQDDIDKRAAELVAVRTFNQKCDEAFDAGAKAHPDFAAAIKNLNMAGVIRADNIEFLQAALDTDAPDQVLYALGNDPDEALRIANLSVGRRAIEMNKIAERLSKPAASPARKAPPPIAPIEGAGAPGFDPETAPMAEFIKWRDGKR